MNLKKLYNPPSRSLKYRQGVLHLRNGDTLGSRFIEELNNTIYRPVWVCADFVCRNNPNSDRVIYSGNPNRKDIDLGDYRKPFVPTTTTVFV